MASEHCVTHRQRESRFGASICFSSDERRSLLPIALVLGALASAYPLLATSSYTSGPDFHATIEMVGALLGLIAGLALVVHFYSLGNRFHLFIGLAFFVNGAGDFVHGLLSFEKMYDLTGLPISALKEFIPGTCVSGRLLMGALLLGAPFTESWFGECSKPKRETIWASLAVIVLAMAATLLAFKISLPRFIYADRFISRPVDFLSAIVLLAAFVAFLLKYLRGRDVLTWWILLSIGINTIGQFMMSFSRGLYDPLSDLAHVYKVLGYEIPLLGCSLYQITVITSRKRAEQALQEAHDELEVRVQERTAKLATAIQHLQEEMAERERVEKSLEESEARVRSILDNAANGIVSIDERGIIESINREAEGMFGYQADELLGENIGILMPSPHREAHDQYLQRYIETGTKHVIGVRCELDGRRKDGSIFPLDLSVSEVHLGEKRVFTGIVRDITRRKQVEEALRQSEEALRDLFENATDLIQMVSPDGRLLYVNRAWRETLGYSQEEVARLSAFDIIHPDHRDHCMKVFQRLMAGETVKTVESVFITKDGKGIPVDGSINCRFERGEPVVTRGIFRDITERKRSEEEIARQNRFLNTVLESLPHPFMVIDVEDYSVSLANTAARRDAAPRAETCFAMTRHRDSPCGGAKCQCPLVEVKQTGKPVIVEQMNCQADGILQTVEVHVYPVFDENKRVVQVIEYALDITERKRAEEALREGEDRLKLALEGANDGVWDWDVPTGKVVFNDRWAAILGYDLSEIEPHIRSRERLAHPEDMPHVTEALTAHLDGRAPFYESEHRMRTKSGEWKWVLDRGKVVARDKDGRPLRATGTHKDITERKRTERALAEANLELQSVSRQAGMAEVATGVLHNVGNVLNSVNVSSTIVTDSVRTSKVSGLVKATELMREHGEDLATFITTDKKGKNLPEYLAKLAQHLVQEQTGILDELEFLTENIEHIKRIVAMQQAYAGVSGMAESVSIADVLEDAMKINAGGFGRHGVQVVREYEEVPPIVIEKHKLLQILVNVLNNANYAMDATQRKDRTLVLRIAIAGANRVRVDVIDNGVGIAKENLTRVFSHGFTTKKDGHGFGLHHSGLAAQEMGCTLTAYSDGPGKGATFTLEMPLRRAEVAP